jgi:hypothetical protein
MVVALIMIPALFYLPGTPVVIAPFLIREMPQFYGGSTDNDYIRFGWFQEFFCW